MIYVHRKPAPNDFLALSIRKTQLNEIRQWLQRTTNYLSLPKITPRTFQLPDLEETVAAEFHYKCAVCERKLTREQGRISYFRPYSGALPAGCGALPDLAYYGWLIWDWSNLTFVCRACAEHQVGHFPVATTRVTLTLDHLDRENARPYFMAEQPLLIDPSVEAPAQHLEFNERGDVRPRKGSPFGDYVIRRYELNRPELRTARHTEALRFKELWLQAYAVTIDQQQHRLVQRLTELVAACADNQPFAAMKRQLLLDWVDDKQNEETTPQALVDALSKPPWQDAVKQVERLLFPVDALLRVDQSSTFLIRDLTRVQTSATTAQPIFQQVTMILGNLVLGDWVAGDKVGGDQILVGNIKGSHVTIGRPSCEDVHY